MIGCRRTSPPAAPAREGVPPLSKGFRNDPPSPSPDEPEKIVSSKIAGDVALPPELQGRPAPPSGLTVWVDGKLVRTVAADELKQPVPLPSLISEPAGVRTAMVHGDGNLWLAGSDLGGFRVKVNRRGLVKLEATRPSGGGGGGDEDDDRSAKQLKDVKWIEVRTRKSPHLAGEP